METILKGRVAMVTGAGTGIGLGIAKEFVKQGATVIIMEREQEQMGKAVAEIGQNSSGIKSDVSSLPQMESFYQEVLELPLIW